VNEILAKLSQNEKIYGVGALVAVVSWLVGLVATNSWYGYSGAQGLGLLAVVAAIVGVVVLYLNNAPGTKITWPMPVVQILLGLAAIVAILALLGLLMAFTYDPCGGLCNGILNQYGAGKPAMLYVVALGVLVGGAAMCYAAYMDFTAKK
jgi:hypothetical protein